MPTCVPKTTVSPKAKFQTDRTLFALVWDSLLQIPAVYGKVSSGDDMKKQVQGTIALLIGTIIWGSAFVAQSVGMERIGPFTFQTARCALAVLALTLTIFLSNPRQFLPQWKNKKLWKAGILCGIALFVAASLQQVGLVYTDAGKAGFLTAMYIVLVPLLGILLGKKPPKTAFLSVLLAMAGLYLLSCMGVTKINIGDLLLLACALAFAVQITLIDRLAEGLDGLRLNCIQCLVCAVLSAPVMLLTETIHWADILDSWLPIGYAGVLSMGVAYSLQIVGQKKLDPTAASLIMSLESVFAALTGWLVLHETLTAAETLGCVLMFGAVILSQVPAGKGKP